MTKRNGPGRRTQQQRRTETERRVLDAAITLIARHGSRSVSLADVGALAGYSRGIVNHHFGSKEQLLAAVVLRAQQFDVPTTDRDGLEQLTLIVATYLRNLNDRAPAGQAFLLLWAEAVASDQVLSPIYAERDTWFRNLIAGHVQHGIDDGSIRSDAEPYLVAISLLGTLRGIGMQLMSSADCATLDELVQQVVDMVRRGLASHLRQADATRRVSGTS